ncbi:tetratricopeptide repeat protein [bacterium]|nr:tetratricopeptide repeat protein [bacterium]
MRKLKACVLMLVAYILCASVPEAWSQKAEALQWFTAGVSEKEVARKIQAYERAIELDPLFVEALYNLGMVYKSQQDYAQAEQFLLKANNAKTEKTPKDLNVRILYELSTTYAKTGKLQEAEAGLRKAQNAVDEDRIASMISFELGRLLHQQQRYAEALTELRAGMNRVAENRGKFATLMLTIQNEQQMQTLYEKATQAKQTGKLADARVLFEEILQQDPNFKDVAAQLERLDSQQKVDANKAVFNSLYEEARKYETAGNLELAIAAYEKLLLQAGVYKDARSRVQELRQQNEKIRTQKKLEEQYILGMSALKAKDWARALIIFENILQADREFRDARRRRNEAQRGLDRESSETVVARFYAEGVAAMGQGDLTSALAAFEKVHKINQDYRDIASLLVEVEEQIQKQGNASAEMSAAAAPVADSLYQNALAAIQQEDWAQAVTILEKLQAASPEDANLVDLLAQARTNLQISAVSVPFKEAGPGHSVLMIGGVLAAVIVLPLIGFVTFSPTVRARVSLLRGDYQSAAQIYERMLQQKPGRLKLYPVLADIYLMTGRRDEQALKVFKTILQLNLLTANRDEINAAVAQTYLSQGRIDAEAIKVFEDALQAEYRKTEQMTRSKNGR